MDQRLGQYRIERKLADGRMGVVYLGVAPNGQRVVLKVPLLHDQEAAVALADEARAGLRLRHPGVVETLDFFADGGKRVLVVAYIDGPTLFQLRKLGPLPANVVAEIGQQLASALEAIHGATDERARPLNMIHRDVSPTNVLIDKTGQVRLIDLGIARSTERRQAATATTVVKGTLRYLAPELMGDDEPSASMDLWALGVTLWEAAIGRYAVEADDTVAMRKALDGSLYKTLAAEPIDPSLLEVLQVLVAPQGSRLLTARAASNVLTGVCRRLPGGRAQLGAIVRGDKNDPHALLPHESTENFTLPPEKNFRDLPDTRDTSGDVFAGSTTEPRPHTVVVSAPPQPGAKPMSDAARTAVASAETVIRARPPQLADRADAAGPQAAAAAPSSRPATRGSVASGAPAPVTLPGAKRAADPRDTEPIPVVNLPPNIGSNDETPLDGNREVPGDVDDDLERAPTIVTPIFGVGDPPPGDDRDD